jgi:hypothetical protein
VSFLCEKEFGNTKMETWTQISEKRKMLEWRIILLHRILQMKMVKRRMVLYDKKLWKVSREDGRLFHIIILRNPGVDGRIILKWTCERLDGGGHGLDQSGSG